ncbi:MAG: endonuclease MutS2 [Lachnospiraceae bacterium]|nr:endonuclease MutS2 [Lachnospiraceae bacterium]
MNTKVYKTLEFDKILEQLARCASSEAGAALCEKTEPLTNIEEIRTAQLQTTDAVNRLRKKAGPHLGLLPDIRPSLKRLAIGSILNAVELLEITAILDAAWSANRFLKPENDEAPVDSLSVYYDVLDPCSNVSNEIKRCILSYDEIADDASPKLRDIRRHMANARSDIQRTLNRIVTSQSMKTYLQDSVVTMRNGRYCIPVRQEHRSHVPGMIHDQSGSGSTVFIEPQAVVQLNNQIKELELAEKAEIQVILATLSSMASEVSDQLLSDYRLLVELDFILAKARYSEKIKGNAPDFNEDGYLNLKQARHPLLEVQKAVPINVRLGGQKGNEDVFDMLIVTGPNTGGKTVSLKTTGLLCLMGQAGLHIPALDGSSLCIFQEIYADIGDEQSIEQSLSTFSSHMKNIVEILEKADSDSLVLLDELCSGTDPAEGAALAQAILTRLHYYGSKVMATTHYPELKVFALTTEGVQNACCEFDVETLRPTYRLLIGLPGKSSAFAISEKLGLDTTLIGDAKKRLDSGNVAFEDLLANIESDRKNAEFELAEASRMRAEASAALNDLKKKQDAIDAKRQAILDKANEEAYEVLKEAKDYADQAVKDIRRAEKGGDMSRVEKTRSGIGKKTKESLEKRGFKPEKKTSYKSLSADSIKIGDAVHVISMNMDGSVTSLPDSKGNVSVQLGSMNMQVKLKDLEEPHEDTMAALENTSGKKGAFAKGAFEKASRQKGSGISSIKFEKSMGVSTEIKLLGMTTDEALLELGKYIDDASMAHLEKVRIVHGKGTGALRSAVQQYLRREKRVKKFYQAEYGEGDAGVTIAELK